MTRAAIRIELESIAAAHGGRLQAVDVVVAAEPVESPLHDQFTWDDAEAARLRRLDEARALIRTLTVRFVSDDTDGEIRTWFPARSVLGPNETGYVAESDVRADPEARAAMLRALKREWLAFRRRYQDLEEFWSVVLDDEGISRAG